MRKPKYKVGEQVVAKGYDEMLLREKTINSSSPEIGQMTTINDLYFTKNYVVYYFYETGGGMYEEDLMYPTKLHRVL